MAKKKVAKPERDYSPPDWRRLHPEYEERIKDMEVRFGVSIYMGKYMVGLTDRYQASAKRAGAPYEIAWGSGETADQALRALAGKLGN